MPKRGKKQENRADKQSQIGREEERTREERVGRSHWLHFDRIAHAFEPSDESLLDELPIPFVDVLASQVLGRGAITQEVRDDHEDAVSHRHRCFLCASSGRNPTILGGKRGVVAVRSSVSRLNEHLTGRRVAFARLAGKAFACTFLMAWADTNPGREVCGGGKWPHIHPDLGEQPLSDPLTDPGTLIDEIDRLLPVRKIGRF
ncbi:MAG TPA: hypothetical protein VGF67_18180 [Ktedonobacteraceae bacterium]